MKRFDTRTPFKLSARYRLDRCFKHPSFPIQQHTAHNFKDTINYHGVIAFLAPFQQAAPTPATMPNINPSFPPLTVTEHRPSPVMPAAPLTPPPSNDPLFDNPKIIAALKFICKYRAGKNITPAVYDFPLLPEEYNDLKEFIQGDSSLFGVLEDKLRYSYDTGTACLRITMPSFEHEAWKTRFCVFISSSIQVLWDLLLSTPPLDMTTHQIANFKNVMRDFYEGGTAKCRLTRDGTAQMDRDGEFLEPDAQWRVANWYFPCIVLEFAYAQSMAEARVKAKKWIERSNRGVNVVIIIDLTYNRPERPTAARNLQTLVEIWRRREEVTDGVRYVWAEAVLEEDMIRNPDGSPSGEMTRDVMGLRLRDFAPFPLTQGAYDHSFWDNRIRVPAQQVFDMVTLGTNEGTNFRGDGGRQVPESNEPIQIGPPPVQVTSSTQVADAAPPSTATPRHTNNGPAPSGIPAPSNPNRGNPRRYSLRSRRGE